MSQASTVVFAFSVINLLLCAVGLLFVYFDWNAARRREYLYLYFTEEKPGYDYFSAARRRRVQYTRLIVAFSVLSLRQFLSVLLAATITDPSAWNQYSLWWHEGPITPSIGFAVAIWPWLGLLEIMGLAWLGFALLYEARQETGKDQSLVPMLVIAGFATVWAVFVVCFVTGLLGTNAYTIVHWFTFGVRCLLLVGFIALLMRRQHEKLLPGLLVFTPSTMMVAFGAWLFLSAYADIVRSPAAYPFGLFVAFSLIVMALARGTLNDYETTELTRHRLGRERGVIFSFLKRLGEAFTTEVEVDQILGIILESALETTEASAGAIYLVNTQTHQLEPRVVLNFFPPMYVEAAVKVSERRTEELEDEMKAQNFALGEGIIGEVGKTGHGQLISDVRAAGIMLGTTTEYMRNRSMLVVPLRVRDETLGVMAVLNKQRSSFGLDDQSLLQALADQASLSINNAMLTVEVAKQERLRRDLQIARDIQQRLLPDHCPEIPGFEIAARATSALEVGGDYYDFFWVDQDHLGIVVADVSGKGVYAALVVAMIRSAFRTQAPGNLDVRDVLSRVNTFISEDLRRDMFVTCVYGILEISTRRFSWARAGHEPLVLAHEGDSVKQMAILSPDGFALGVIGAPEFQDLLQVQTVEINSGDRLLMFTDGLTEAMNTKGEEFGLERVLNCLSARASENGRGEEEVLHTNGHNGTSEPQEMLRLEELVQIHVGDAAQSDDLTMVYLVAK